MASMSPPTAYSLGAKDDTEVLSQRTAPSRGGAQDAVQEAPQGETSAAGHTGEQIPMETGEEGRIQFGPQPNTIPGTSTALESGTHLPSKEGGAPIPPMAPVQPGAPDNLMEALRGASIVDEHRVLMGTVIEKVQSVKSGLNEACNNLLTGFEVSHVGRERHVLTVAPETLSGVRKEMPDRGSTLCRRLTVGNMP